MLNHSSRGDAGVVSPTARHREVIISQTKTRQRVRDLAEVYTHEREVTAMLDLVSDMFPSLDRPRDIGRTFLEPACGAGNFLVGILDRKLAYVKFGGLYRSVATFETAVLRALSSIYGIDIDPENVEQSRQFLKADIAHHMNLQLNTVPVSDGFWLAVEAILGTNVIRADTLKDGQRIRLVEYHWQRKTGYVIRDWSPLEEPNAQFDLFGEVPDECQRDEVAIHYSLLADSPEAVRVERHGGRTK
ncbi:hypothetical protein NLS1_07810 [Nocardioides sp. LS1]|nr:hypothetical protein NLS1_07810 [Nocardioides sp. LS1]